MKIPMNTGKVIIFVSWLLQERGIKSSSVESYLSGLKTLHRTEGHNPPEIRPDLVKSILAGAKNYDNIQDRIRPKSKRLPMSMSALRVLKNELNNQDMTKSDIRMMWAVSCLAFFGSFRMGEILAEAPNSYDKVFTCLAKDVDLKDNTIRVRVKNPKEDRAGRDLIIDVFKNDGDCCPVKALGKWWMSEPPRENDKPCFRFADGANLSKRCFNNILTKCLAKHVPTGTGFYSGHSFRAGIPSMLGEMGYSDDDIRTVGRWSSNSYELYVKMPRTKRQKMAKEIAAWKN